MKNVNMIVACDLNGGIGYKNDLPWNKNKEDMRWFKNNTNGHIIVMGKNTWNSIGANPLPNRINYIVTSKSSFHLDFKDNVRTLNPLHIHLPVQIEDLSKKYPDLKIWIMGGAKLYNALYPYCENLYLTLIEKECQCDTYLNNSIFEIFQKKVHEERLNEYSLVKILKKGK